MEIAVLGGGHGCYAAAADLADKGHRVRFWRRDAEAFAPVLDTATIALKDPEGDREATLALATTDVGEAITGADLIVMGLSLKRHQGEFTLGTTIPYVLRKAPCRVWVSREPAANDALQPEAPGGLHANRLARP